MTLPAIDSPVRIGLVGLGAGRNAPSGADQSPQRLAGLGGVRRPRENLAARTRSVRTSRPGLSDLLARDDLDYVLIAAPQNVRAELGGPGARGGKKCRRRVAAVCRRQRSKGHSGGRQPHRPDALRSAQPAGGVRFSRGPASGLGRQSGDDRGGTHRFVGQGGPVRLRGAGRQPTDSRKSLRETECSPFSHTNTSTSSCNSSVGRPKTVFARISHPPTSDPTATAFFLSIAFRGGGDGADRRQPARRRRAADRMDACRNDGRLLPAANPYGRAVRRSLRRADRPGRRSAN